MNEIEGLFESVNPLVQKSDDLTQQMYFDAFKEKYGEAIEKQDIANTKIGNKAVRKKNFKQVMQESFFYGSNRFGNNFIA